MKYGTSAQILYENEMFDVTGTEYCEWEDRLDAAGVTMDSPDGKWMTFDFLFNLGHLVSKPKAVAKPKAVKGVRKPTKKVHKNAPRAPDGKPPLDSWEVRDNPREPVWTQSKVLAERERLIKQEERLLLKQKRAFANQVKTTQTRVVNQPAQFYHEDGTPYSSGNYVSALITMTILLFALGFCAWINF